MTNVIRRTLAAPFRSASPVVMRLFMAVLVLLACLPQAMAQSATTTALTVTPNSGVSGSIFSLAVAVQSGGSAVTGGTVQFTDSYNGRSSCSRLRACAVGQRHARRSHAEDRARRRRIAFHHGELYREYKLREERILSAKCDSHWRISNGCVARGFRRDGKLRADSSALRRRQRQADRESDIQ